MNPAVLDDMSWAMAEVYASVTDRILINLARHFPYVREGARLPGSFEYQARMLAQAGQVNRETVQIIMDVLGEADEALRGVLERSILEGLRSEEPKLRRAAERGLLQTPARPEMTANMTQAFQSYYRQAADRLNLVNTVMLESTQAAYTGAVSDAAAQMLIAETQRTLNVAAGEVITGVSSFNAAMRTAVDRMVNNGLTGFVDHAGRHWSPEAYVAMDIRTTTANTARQAVFDRNQEYGNDLYQVSSHQGARPLCFPWQGKIISTSGRRGYTEDLDGNRIPVHSEDEIESFRYGGGLFGVNCGHYPMVFIPGFSTLKGEPQDEEANAKTYAESQEQRRLERKLREEKRDLEVMKAQGAPEEQIRAQKQRVRDASADIDDFCEQTGRARHRDREGAPVRATWPGGSGDVTRYNGSYIGTDVVPPPKRIPREPPTPGVAPVVPEPPQADPLAVFANVQGLDDEFKRGMAEAMQGAGVPEAQAVFTRYADELVCVDNSTRGGAYFSGGMTSGGVHMNAAKVAAGSAHQYPYEVAFHEFGHMIDWIGGGRGYPYLSNTPLNGQSLLAVIKSDFQAFKKMLGVSRAADVIPILKAEGMDLRTCGNISDILEKLTGVSYPLGCGHGVAYHKRPGATEREFFAEVLDSAVTNPASYAQMVRLFPHAVDLVWQMVRSVI